MPKFLITRRVAVLAAAAVLVAGAVDDAAQAAPPDQADFVDVLGRDLYVLAGASLVNPEADTDPDEQLYNVAGLALTTAPGDPLTWGEWSAATATSRTRTIGGPNGPRTDVRLWLHNLVPGGVYSVFWATLGPDSEHLLCPNVERTLPLDALKPDADAAPNSFVADASGAAEFHGRVDGDLLAPTQVFYSVVYHADGKTYYPFPNRGQYLTHDDGTSCRSSYGHDAMRHLVILQKW